MPRPSSKKDTLRAGHKAHPSLAASREIRPNEAEPVEKLRPDDQFASINRRDSNLLGLILAGESAPRPAAAMAK